MLHNHSFCFKLVISMFGEHYTLR